MVIIHPFLNTCFDRNDIQNSKNINWVSGSLTGTFLTEISALQYIHICYRSYLHDSRLEVKLLISFTKRCIFFFMVTRTEWNDAEHLLVESVNA